MPITIFSDDELDGMDRAALEFIAAQYDLQAFLAADRSFEEIRQAVKESQALDPRFVIPPPAEIVYEDYREADYPSWVNADTLFGGDVPRSHAAKAITGSPGGVFLHAALPAADISIDMDAVRAVVHVEEYFDDEGCRGLVEAVAALVRAWPVRTVSSESATLSVVPQS